MGNDAKLGVEPHMFISTPRLDSVLADMVRTHASGDICLVGGRGVGKSALVNKVM
jgi:putative ribosome biogenesis GTPase RsgA